jgi:uncharacterized protein YbjT (DUF2867 family)
MSDQKPILVTGAAGKVGAVGRTVVERLRQHDLPVRALVRLHDERAEALSAMGAEVVVGDLTHAADVAHALEGCRRMYFGMSVSPAYLEATVIAAAAARERGDLEAFVNISQMTVSQMSLTNMTDSSQQRQHWLAEQVLGWSGLPVVQVRPTVFLEHFFFSAWAASSIARDGEVMHRRTPDILERPAAVPARQAFAGGRTAKATFLTFLISLGFRCGLVWRLIRRSSWLCGLFPDQFGKPIRRFIKANAQPVAFAPRDLAGKVADVGNPQHDGTSGFDRPVDQDMHSGDREIANSTMENIPIEV